MKNFSRQSQILLTGLLLGCLSLGMPQMAHASPPYKDDTSVGAFIEYLVRSAGEGIESVFTAAGPTGAELVGLTISLPTFSLAPLADFGKGTTALVYDAIQNLFASAPVEEEVVAPPTPEDIVIETTTATSTIPVTNVYQNTYVTNPTTVIRETTFVQRQLFDRQVNATYDSFGTSLEALGESFTTDTLTVTGNATTGGNFTVSGNFNLASGVHGPLQANGGLVSATSSIGVVYGGTGLTTAPAYGQLLLGNSSGGYTLTATSSLGLASTFGATYPIEYAGNVLSLAFGTTTNNTWSGTNNYTSTVALASTSPWGLLSINPDGITGPSFVIGSSTATNFIVTNAGDVGIGTHSPSEKLSIFQAGGTADDIFRLRDITDALDLVFRYNGDDFEIRSEGDGGGNNYLTFENTTGNVGIGTTSPQSKLEIAAAHSQLQFTDSDDSKYIHLSYSGGGLAFRPNSLSATPTLWIDNDSRVGVNNLSPGARLEITSNSTDNVPALKVDGGGDASTEYVGYFLGRSSSFPSTVLRLASNSISSSDYKFIEAVIDEDGTPSTAFAVGGDGTVAIGTTTSGVPLHVYETGEIVRLEDSSGTGSPFLSFYQTGIRRSYIQHADSGDALRLASEYGDVSFYTGTAGTEVFAGLFDENQNFGIQDASPTEATLVVGSSGAGDIFLSLSTAGTTNNAVCWDNSGATLLYDCDSTPADYAESYATTPDVTYGEIVMTTGQSVIQTDGATSPKLTKAVPGEGAVIGITSDNYHDFTSAGLDLINAQHHPLPVALNGRVPVKVNMEGGPIHTGDRIVLSSVPGVGKKATESGTSIGIALENQDEEGMVLAFVNLGHYFVPENITLLDFLASSTATTTSQTVFTAFFGHLSTWLADATNGIVNVIADRFEAREEICVDDQCLTEDDVRALLELIGESGSASVEDAPEEPPVVETPPEEPVIEDGEDPAPVVEEETPPAGEAVPPEEETPQASEESLSPEPSGE